MPCFYALRVGQDRRNDGKRREKSRRFVYLFVALGLREHENGTRKIALHTEGGSLACEQQRNLIGKFVLSESLRRVPRSESKSCDPASVGVAFGKPAFSGVDGNLFTEPGSNAF